MSLNTSSTISSNSSMTLTNSSSTTLPMLSLWVGPVGESSVMLRHRDRQGTNWLVEEQVRYGERLGNSGT
jgi:hypothetical protein